MTFLLRLSKLDGAGASPELFNRGLFSRRDGSPVYRLHRQEKRIGRGCCRKAIDESVRRSLPIQGERLPVASTDFCPPFPGRFFKSLNDELLVFHPLAPDPDPRKLFEWITQTTN